MMSESEMGYRGSKSVFLSDAVKEQRVDGSWVFPKGQKGGETLRCILVGLKNKIK